MRKGFFDNQTFLIIFMVFLLFAVLVLLFGWYKGYLQGGIGRFIPEVW